MYNKLREDLTVQKNDVDVTHFIDEIDKLLFFRFVRLFRFYEYIKF